MFFDILFLVSAVSTIILAVMGMYFFLVQEKAYNSWDDYERERDMNHKLQGENEELRREVGELRRLSDELKNKLKQKP